MNFFITGISTDVGKTIASAIVTEALQADYWKPVQAGDLHLTDSMKVQRLISNPKTVIHPEAFRLKTPASPHLAAEIDQVEISASDIAKPETSNHLVIEGAGGVHVPLNASESVIDLIKPDDVVLVVSRHYLGSINHTLLTIESLQSRGLNVGGIIFSGENPSTEELILSRTALPLIGRIAVEPYFDKDVILEYADVFRPELLKLTNEPQAN